MQYVKKLLKDSKLDICGQMNSIRIKHVFQKEAIIRKYLWRHKKRAG